MALTTSDVNAVRAQWEEWVPDGFRLAVEVRGEDPQTGMLITDPTPFGARLISEHYCQVEVFKLHFTPETDGIVDAYEERVFSERVPHDAAALRASVTVLARTIARHQAAGSDD